MTAEIEFNFVSSLLSTAKLRNRQSAAASGANEDEDVSDDDQHDGDATAARRRERQTEERDFEGEEDEVREMMEEGQDIIAEDGNEEESGEDCAPISLNVIW